MKKKMNKYIQSGKDNPAPEYYDLMLRKKLKMEKTFQTTVYIKTKESSIVNMGTQWGLTEKDSIDKVMFQFNIYAKDSDFGAEDVFSIETKELNSSSINAILLSNPELIIET